MTHLILLILLIALAEIKARKRFMKEHSIPFHPKKVGEYPYNEFINECGPPLHWTLKPGYSSRQVHINSLGQRGPEPEADRRKIWVVGESELFGAKLAQENRIWFKKLQKTLDEEGYAYQVMNASIIGYNGQQTAETVCALPLEPGDILLLRPNINDLSIALAHGADWEPGTPWPMAFIRKLQRHKPWYFKMLDQSCLGSALRRRLVTTDEKAKAFAERPGFQHDRLFKYSVELLNRMIRSAADKGARVVMFDCAFSYEPEIKPEQEGAFSALQANWYLFCGNGSRLQFELLNHCIEQVAWPNDLPVLHTAPHFWNHPRRFQLYLDIMHFNADGHEVYAQALWRELCDKNILEKDPS